MPDGVGFTGKDRQTMKESFLADEGNQKLWERLKETKERLPWTRQIVTSLQEWVEKHGSLTEKQKGLATSLYIDACVISDDKLFEQAEARKLGYRLMELRLGRIHDTVHDIMLKSDGRILTPGQIGVFQGVAKQQCVKLTLIPKMTEENFDGWFKTAPIAEPEEGLDK